jgi:hypothetical protein
MNNSDMNDFYDIFGVWHEPWWQTLAWKVFAIVLIGIIATGIIYLVVRTILKRRKARPYWEVALMALHDLRASGLCTTERAKNFYVQLTDILKRYITERYGISVQGSTDKEILAYLEDHISFPKESLPILRDIFHHAGSIKFANESALLEYMEQDLALGLRLVKETMPFNK